MVKCINFRKNFIFLVCQKEFADELINRISPNLEPSQAIQDKVLSLIQSWAHAFSSDPDLRGVAEVYMDLKKKGVEFPIPSDDDLLLVQSNQVRLGCLNIFPNPPRVLAVQPKQKCLLHKQQQQQPQPVSPATSSQG